MGWPEAWNDPSFRKVRGRIDLTRLGQKLRSTRDKTQVKYLLTFLKKNFGQNKVVLIIF